MGKKKTAAEPYKDVKELNWEETEEENLTGSSTDMDIVNNTTKDTGIEDVPASWGVLEQLAGHLEKVEPEIRKGNPVWHWALCDDHCTFIFRDGRKVTVSF